MYVIHVIYVYHWLFYKLMSVSKIKVSCYTSLYPFFLILFINLKPLKNINMSVSVLDCLQKHQHKSFLLLISTRCLIKLYSFLYMITDSNTSGHRCHKHYQISQLGPQLKSLMKRTYIRGQYKDLSLSIDLK